MKVQKRLPKYRFNCDRFCTFNNSSADPYNMDWVGGYRGTKKIL